MTSYISLQNNTKLEHVPVAVFPDIIREHGLVAWELHFLSISITKANPNAQGLPVLWHFSQPTPPHLHHVTHNPS